MRVVVSGIPGVGKSTVLEMLKKKTDYEIINFGTLMYEMARDIGLVKSRDELRKLPIDTQINLQKKASAAIGKMENVVIDTHMTIKTPDGYMPGLPEWVIRELKCSAYFVIEADPESILKRRTSDGTRSRDSEMLDDIIEHQSINRSFVASCSIYTGATVSLIKNEDGKAELAAQNIVRRLMKNA
ncbi:MAG: adenylate kinase [Thermoplasmataceae archaeon]|jgi:adenylate kinase